MTRLDLLSTMESRPRDAARNNGVAMKIYDQWIGPEDSPLFRLFMGESEPDSHGKHIMRVVSVSRDSLVERLGGLSKWGDSFEELILRLADGYEEAARELRAFAPGAQKVMDSGDASMTPLERAVAIQIGQFLHDNARSLSGKKKEELHELASMIQHGVWKDR